jgi:hypothetical protein
MDRKRKRREPYAEQKWRKKKKSRGWRKWSIMNKNQVDEVELTGSMKAAAERNPNLGFSKWTLVFISRVK